MKKLLFPLMFCCFAILGRSQEPLNQDSLLNVIQQIITEDSLVQEEMRFNRDGLFMPLRGIIQTFTHREFNQLPGPFSENNQRWGDYGLALSPLAATWVMKACGLKSRSTTKRMLVSNGIAAGLTVGLSQMLRWSVNEERPDGSDHNSFPSMHSALAFMGATVLSREYGHISPWISVGGYAAATGTQMLRIGHNSHWMNDIFMGAGIGVVSTQVAYYLTDRIIGSKGINRMPLSRSEQKQLWFFDKQASGFRLVSGSETNGRTLIASDFAEAASGFDMTGVKLRSSASITTGFEVEWFLNRNLFLSAIGRYTMSQAKLEIPDNAVTAWGEQIHIYHGNITAGWSFSPLVIARTTRFGVRTLWGVRYNEGITFHKVAEGRQVGESLLSIKSQLRPEGGAGINIDMLQSHNQTVGMAIDYLHTFGTHFLPNRWSITSSWKAMF